MNKKLWLILLIILGLGVASYAAAYFLRTEKVHSLLCHDQQGLLWLKEEYHLSDVQFEEVEALHKAYMPRCEAMCREIREARQQLEQAIHTNASVSPEVVAALEHSNRIRGECEQATLEHIYAVSQNMNPTDGKRFVETMTKHLLLQAQAGEM